MLPNQDTIILPGRTLWIPRNGHGPSIDGPFFSWTLQLLRRIHVSAHHQNARLGTDRSSRSLEPRGNFGQDSRSGNDGTGCDAHTNRSILPVIGDGTTEGSFRGRLKSWPRQMSFNAELMLQSHSSLGLMPLTSQFETYPGGS